MLISLLLLQPATATEWVAVRADATHCVETAGPKLTDPPCVSLAGGGTHGALFAQVVADRGAELAVQWARSDRGACVAAPSPPLADLGLTLTVPTAAVLAVVSEPTTLDLGDGASLELRPGLPLWPAEDHELVVVHLRGVEVVVGGQVPNSRSVPAQPGVWPSSRGMAIELGALPLPQGVRVAPLAPQTELQALWDEDAHAIVLQEDCARLVLPVADGAAPGGPGKRQIQGLSGKQIQAVLAQDTVLTLPSGRPVGRTTSTVTIGPTSSGLDSANIGTGSHLTSPRGGRTCFAVPTTDDASLPWDRRFLELCAATASLR